MLRIKDIMSANPMAIEVSIRLGDAKKIMAQHSVRHLPVMQEGSLVGILTDRDIKLAQAVSSDELFDEHKTAGDICVRFAYTVSVDESARLVLEHMWKERIGSALVTENDNLVGIFTVTDACKHFSALLEKMNM